MRDATFLAAVLPYALAQAKRHREPLTVMCVEIDGVAALTRSHGPSAVADASRRLAESVAKALRGSDVVTRLDDDRLVVMLPNTGAENALIVAEVVRGAVAETAAPPPVTGPLTASIGTASYPHDGEDMLALLHAADEAMNAGRETGPNGVARFEDLPGADRPPLSVLTPPPPVAEAEAVVDADSGVIPLTPARRDPQPRRQPAAR
ncbi:MAG: GGDEF domain-containing protein [Isosphaeraceae bacterium]